MRFSFSTLARKCLRVLCQPLLRLLRNWTAPYNQSSPSPVADDRTRSRMDLIIENAFLRYQLAILRRQGKRQAPTKSPRR